MKNFYWQSFKVLTTGVCYIMHHIFKEVHAVYININYLIFPKKNYYITLIILFKVMSVHV